MKKLNWILAILLLNQGAAHAIESVPQPFTLSCQGELGDAFFQQTEKGISYSVNTEHKHFSGLVAPYLETGSCWEQGGASIIDPAYEHNKKWLSVSALHGHKQWHPAHKSCLPTRNLDSPCREIDVPGYYSNVPDVWLTLMVDITEPGKVKYMNLDIFEKEFANLGENVKCTLNGI